MRSAAWPSTVTEGAVWCMEVVDGPPGLAPKARQIHFVAASFRGCHGATGAGRQIAARRCGRRAPNRSQPSAASQQYARSRLPPFDMLS